MMVRQREHFILLYTKIACIRLNVRGGAYDKSSFF